MNIDVIIAVKTLKPLLWEVQHLNAPPVTAMTSHG